MAGWPKVIRDPVHDVIELRNTDAEHLIFDLINTPEMQRLRRIKQLGFSDLVYPGANHTRLAHSIGVMQTARRMLGTLRKYNSSITEDEITCITVTALLHDIGHGPFSHAFEKVTKRKHEKWTEQIIQDPSTEIFRVLSERSTDLPTKVARLFDKTAEEEGQTGNLPVLMSVVSSQLDADRMDYLLRDSLMSGAKLGQFDLTWLLRCVRVDFSSRTLFLSSKGLQAAEAYIFARHHMFNSVYFHKTTRAAEVMLKALLQAATDALVSEVEWQDLAPGAPISVKETLLGEIDLETYLLLDDGSLWEFIKCAMKSKQGTISRLADGLLNRNLLKPMRIEIKSVTKLTEFMQESSKVILECGYDPKYFFLEDGAADVPFKVYDPVANPEVKNIYVESGGKLRPLQELSPPVAALKEYQFTRCYLPKDCLEKVDFVRERLYS